MITVQNVMNTDIPLISATDSALKAATLLRDKKTRILVVMRNGNVVGVLPEETILRETLLNKKNIGALKVADLMHRAFHTLSPKASFLEVEMLFKGNPQTRLVVMENGKLEGIITELDMVAALRDFTRKDYIIQDAILILFGIITGAFILYFSPLGMMIL